MLGIEKAIVILLILCFESIKCCRNSSIQDQLIFAHIIFRHGDRNIIKSFKTDPWKDRKYWPEGFGQLTNVGKMQHYKLGQYFRKRYSPLIGNGEYLSDIIYAQSTDSDRTLTSAESNLCGFFPPDSKQLWDKNIKWQPIPIHTIPQILDPILAAKKPCPRYDREAARYRRSSQFRRTFAKYEYLYQYLSTHTGKPVNSLYDAQEIYNILWIEHLKNFTLPEWAEKIFRPGCDFEKLANLYFQLPTNTTTLARLNSGFLLREMLDRFEDKINSNLSPNRSIWMYSAHDVTLAGVLNTLGLFKPPVGPPYASSVLFELYKSSTGNYIQIFYKNSESENLSPLNIPSCGTKCSVLKFRKIYASVIPTADHDTECQ